jgi:acyl-CoA hydrolase
MDGFQFVNPVPLGHFVCIFASVNWAGRTSMEVGVRVESENPLTGVRTHVASSYMTFVALDHNRKPQAVPKLIVETDEDKRRFKGAELRRASRLKLKEALSG